MRSRQEDGSNHRVGRLLAALTVVALAAGPLFSYTIVLKDGSTLTAKEKFEVQGKKAVVTLPNGTQTIIDLSAIDLAKTDNYNQRDFGTAMVVEGGRVKPLDRRQTVQPQTLTDYLRQRQQAGGTSIRQETSERAVRMTPAGFDDLIRLPKQSFEDESLARSLSSMLRDYGLDNFEVREGSRASRPLVEVVTNNETEVFDSLTAACKAFTDWQTTLPNVDTLELLMVSTARSRAGQFVLTKSNAPLLANDTISAVDFFLEFVQF